MSDIFLDIETFTGTEKETPELPNKPTVSDIKVGNLKDEAKIKSKIEEQLPILISDWESKCKLLEEKADEKWRKGATSIYQSEIICLCYAIDDKDSVKIIGNSKEIIKAFGSVVDSLHSHGYEHNIVGHNIKRFDLPILFLNACKYDVHSLKGWFPAAKYSDRIFDTMEKFTYLSDLKYVSMDDCLKFFGLQGKGDIDGSMVHDMYLSGDIDKIAEYCCNDVNKVRELYNKLS